MLESIAFLHLSDIQFGRNHRFGRLADVDSGIDSLDSLFSRLSHDLDIHLSAGTKIDFVVVSGDLAENGAKKEFDDACEFLARLAKHLSLPRSRFIVIPGNHDINRNHCAAYFNTCEG